MASKRVPTVTEIGPGTSALQAAFCDYVPRVFTRADGDLPSPREANLFPVMART